MNNQNKQNKRKKQNKSSKNIILGIILVFVIMLTLLGLTYAYYRTKIIGNTNEKSISIVNKKLELVYNDNKAVLEASDIVPGTEYEKDFQVTNTGDETDYFSIKLEDVENTFDRREDWTYTLYRLNSKEDNDLIDSKIIKSGMLPNTDSWLVYKEEIESEKTNYYKLKIEYIDLEDIDQSEDMGKTLSFKINIDSEIDNEFTNAEEGTLLNAIARDNAISETLTTPGKEAAKNIYYYNGMNDTSTTASISTEKQTKTYITYSDKYTLDPENGYSLVNPQVKLYSEIYNELSGKYVGSVTGSEKDVLSNYQNLWQIYQIKSATNANSNNVQYINNNRGLKGIEKELSYTEDDYGISYYFRGKVENNYVTFGGMCWSIVRVLGNGTIKLTLYNKNSSCENITQVNPVQSFITNAVYANESNNVKFKTSKVLEILNKWLEEKGLDTSDKIEPEGKWCEDFSISSTVDTNAHFGAEYRKEPTLRCRTLKNGVEDSIYTGNVALLNLDEIKLAGLGNQESRRLDYYLYTSEGWWWTMSPVTGSTEGQGASSYFRISSIPHASMYWPSYSNGIRPCIILKSNVLVYKGNGTQSNPYKIDNS